MPLPRSPLFFAFGIIVAGLAGRAAIDKALAAHGGGAAVAQWAQLQSVVEMVVGVVAIGIGQGVTVLVARQAGGAERRRVLRAALWLGGAVGALVALAVAGVAAAGGGRLAAWLPVAPGLAALAALGGWFAIAPAVVSAGWLGRQRQDRVFALTVVLLAAPVAAALAGGAPSALLVAQAVAHGLAAAGVALALRAGGGSGDGLWAAWGPGGAGRPLLAYVPVGVAIAVASPLAMILVRGEVSAALSWHEAGRLQAILRVADWVTAIMSGLLATVALPRLSAAAGAGEAEFRRVLAATARPLLGATAALLLALWLVQRPVLVALYDERFAVPAAVVGTFFLGDGLRVASWVIVFALLARRATVWVAVGEFLSMPLFAGLVLAVGDGISLPRAAQLYLLTYAVYLAFNLVGLRATLDDRVRGVP